MKRITGIFFSGGDQVKHKDSFINADGTDSEEMAIIRQRTEAGDLVVSGSSAGTGVMSGETLNGKKIPMISGGESYYALIDEPKTECLIAKCADDLLYDPAGGLGLFNFGIIDMHFS